MIAKHASPAVKKAWYPLFLDLSASRCLVVGAGRVGCRKIDALLRGGVGEILVLDTAWPAMQETWTAGLQQAMTAGRVVFCQRQFRAQDVNGCALVFAATGDRKVNAAVTAAARERGIPCNSADAPYAGDFMTPARVDAGDICLALCTGGESPALSARIRREVAAWLGERYDGLCRLMGCLRPLVLALGHDSEHNGELFRRIVQSPLAECLAQRDREASERLLRELLPQELHPNIAELLDESV